MKHTDWNLEKLMFHDINSDDRSMTCRFLHTGSSFTHFVMRTSFAGRWHMFHNLIRVWNDRQVCSLMTFLSANLFTRRFTQTFGAGFLKPSLEGGLELFLEFLLSCSLSSWMVWLSWVISAVCASNDCCREFKDAFNALTCICSCVFISSTVKETTFFH